MIYLYLGNYAESHPDLAIMAINTYVKDCQHSDPKIRGLALRSLCSLRFSGSYEYMQPAIMEALKDSDPYVRKTAIMGCIKLSYMAPATVKSKYYKNKLFILKKKNF
jgi:AP-4 complex subunit beta-1